MKTEYQAKLIAYFFIFVAFIAVLIVVIVGDKIEIEDIDSRCLAYFRDNFQGFDIAPEVCEHISTGKPLAPYHFGQEYSSSK